MRRDLIQVYLQSPGIAGGRMRRAVVQAETYAAVDPVRGRLLRAGVHICIEEWGPAESLIAGVQEQGDAEPAEQLL